MLHQPVMLQEVLNALCVQPDGIYLDATYGRGGHTESILQQLGPKAKLLAMDRDLDAVHYAQKNLARESRFIICHGSFDMLAQFCREQSVTSQINGILFDLGVSSPQLDNAERGFSFQLDGPLDMRMDRSRGLTVAEWLKQAQEQEIADVLWQFGEERYARRIARRIVQQRQSKPVQTTKELAVLIASASPTRDRHKHPATRSFQALRIHINRELESLENALQQAIEVMARGGRLVVISFHSLEDRIVKRFMRDQARGRQLPRGLPVTNKLSGETLKLIGKPQKPTASEFEVNPRARSAVLRVAERL